MKPVGNKTLLSVDTDKAKGVNRQSSLLEISPELHSCSVSTTPFVGYQGGSVVKNPRGKQEM